jgi:hypothetical protein
MAGSSQLQHAGGQIFEPVEVEQVLSTDGDVKSLIDQRPQLALFERVVPETDELANTARSAQSRRGVGVALRNTATSWRNTRSSTSLDADERPSNNSRFSTPEQDQVEQMQRHNSRSCPDGQAPRSSGSEATGRLLEPHRPWANQLAAAFTRLAALPAPTG